MIAYRRDVPVFHEVTHMFRDAQALIGSRPGIVGTNVAVHTAR